MKCQQCGKKIDPNVGFKRMHALPDMVFCSFPCGEAYEKTHPAQKPTVGRIVHYLSLGSGDGKFPPETQAAIVTGVDDDGSCHLHIFYKTGAFDMVAPFSAEPARGCWSWPPRA